ncbi:MAG: hypothetical protein ABI609_14425 [Acidobacteriota bacterium]
MTRSRSVVLFFLVVAGSAARPELSRAQTLTGIFDMRVLSASGSADGLKKQRLTRDDQPLALGQALLEIRGDLSSTVTARATGALYDSADPSAGVTEAFLEIHPVPRSAWRWRSRIGAFYPALSIENTSAGWTSPYTLSFSAVNTWFAEEIRAQGAEVDLERMGRFVGSASDFGLTGAVFRGNDPAGALLSWRGFALHDRQTRLFERLDLASLPAFAPGGSFFPVQGAFEKPFVELDGRWGYWLGARWSHLGASQLSATYYDNRGDPAVVKDGQWTWRTRFGHLSWHWRPSEQIDILAQALDGDTEMDGFTGPLVHAKFWAAYLLASRTWGPHRLSVRIDGFGIADADSTPDDPNQEHGAAVTAAYFFLLSNAVERRGNWRFGLELLSIRSDRPARRLLREPARGRETSAQLTAQWRF